MQFTGGALDRWRARPMVRASVTHARFMTRNTWGELASAATERVASDQGNSNPAHARERQSGVAAVRIYGCIKEVIDDNNKRGLISGRRGACRRRDRHEAAPRARRPAPALRRSDYRRSCRVETLRYRDSVRHDPGHCRLADARSLAATRAEARTGGDVAAAARTRRGCPA